MATVGHKKKISYEKQEILPSSWSFFVFYKDRKWHQAQQETIQKSILATLSES